jgi:hypothetical protein
VHRLLGQDHERPAGFPEAAGFEPLPPFDPSMPRDLEVPMDDVVEQFGDLVQRRVGAWRSDDDRLRCVICCTRGSGWGRVVHDKSFPGASI